MKKKLLIILLTIIMLPSFKAYTFNETKDIANNYINNNVKNEIYLIKENKIPFIYNDKKISYDNSFITGGLINTYEVNTSMNNNISYLITSLPYWEMKGNIISTIGIADDSNIKVVEYVKKDIKVTGKGTYKEPWKFENMYIVKLISEDETMGRVINNKKYVTYLSSVSFDYETTIGYKYKSNTCNMQNNGNTLILTSVNDDINCIISFEKDMKKITFDNNGGGGCDSVSIQKGQTYGNLCTPSRNNYTFDGWYTSKAYETKIESTDIVNDDITLYAKWEAVTYTLTYNTDGGTSCTNKSIKYGETYGTLCSTSKNGHTFLGWYDENNNQVTSSNVMFKDTTIYAKWKVDKIIYSNLAISCANYSKASYPYSFNYTGNCAVYDDGNDNWRIKFLTSGTLTMNAEVNIDMFLVGGGGNGSWSYPGAGGYTKTLKSLTLYNGSVHSVTIGAAANSTSFGNVASVSAGGSGSLAAGGNYAGKNGESICGAQEGGWGSECIWYNCYSPGAGGSYGNGTTCEFGEGTASGCTRGDGFAYSAGGGGCRNVCSFDTGANGKGLSGDNSGRGAACGGSGSSGVVVIRNAK